MAIKVNDRLKNLIIEEDDEDIATDVTDEVQVNLLSGSPSKQFRDRSDQIVAKDGKPDSKSDIKPGSKSTDSQQTAQEGMTLIQGEKMLDRPINAIIVIILNILCSYSYSKVILVP